MRTTIMAAGVLALAVGLSGCNRQGESRAEAQPARAPRTARVAAAETILTGGGPPRDRGASPARKLFLDVHELGRGKVSAKDVAQAHAKDLATEGKYGVDYKAYWVDEKEGKIYCLAEAPSADAASAVHREAHGLVAGKVMEVTADNATWAPTPGKRLFLDVHRLGAGKVTAKDVAEAHAKDLAAQAKHGVKYLNYWLDEVNGTVLCLSEAPSASAAVAVHREAHGLIPDTIEEVSEGR